LKQRIAMKRKREEGGVLDWPWGGYLLMGYFPSFKVVLNVY
jgi:hypothetical protein